MRANVVFALILSGCVASAAAAAQDISAPRLTLAAALQQAVDANPDLSVLRSQLDLERQRPAQQRFLAPPMVEAQVWQWPVNSFNPADTNMYMFMITQEIPGRGKRALREAAAAKEVTLAESDVAVGVSGLLNEVKQAYASLYIARKAIEVYGESAELLRQLADVAQVKYGTGRISQQDVLKPIVELSRVHGDILALQEQAGRAAARLNVLRNRPADAAIEPLEDPHDSQPVPPPGDLTAVALARQPELTRTRLAVEHAEARLASTRRDYAPDFSLQAGYMLMPHMTDGWMGRIGITWPGAPWSRGRIDARVAESAAAVGVAKARQQAAENRIRLAVQDAYVRAKSAQDRAALLRTTTLPQTRQTLEVSRVAYQSDRVEFQALLDTERVLLQSELEYFRALSDFEQAVADLEQATGVDLPRSAALATEEK